MSEKGDNAIRIKLAECEKPPESKMIDAYRFTVNLSSDYELITVYSALPDYMLEDMSKEENGTMC
jgi:hypothetical protein